MAGPKCTVCQHPQVDEINRLCADQANSQRSIADRFELSPTAIQRHRVNHLPQALARAAGAAAIRRAKGVLDFAISRKSRRLAVLDAVHDRLSAQAEGRDYSQMSDAELLRELRKVQEQAARELGQWEEKHAPGAGGSSIVIVVPTELPPGAPTRPIQIDVPGRMAPRSLPAPAAEILDGDPEPLSDDAEPNPYL